MAEKISFPACYDPASGQKGEILGTLGITLLPPEGSGRDTVVRAEMPVDDRTAQCYGYLSGSAMLAVEEALAGFGSTRLVPDGYKPVGTSVTANHVHAVPYGESVTAEAHCLHLGRTTHLWNVEVRDRQGRLVSTARVLNMIGPLRRAK